MEVLRKKNYVKVAKKKRWKWCFGKNMIKKLINKIKVIIQVNSLEKFINNEREISPSKNTDYKSTFFFAIFPQENRITAWKFCYLLHKVLREGHPLCCQHSMRHRSMLTELGKLWVRFRATAKVFHKRTDFTPLQLII